MKPTPDAPAGGNAFRRFQSLTKRLIAVPKDEVEKLKAKDKAKAKAKPAANQE
jgi:uncharacterized small protein (DUF1192 family)